MAGAGLRGRMRLVAVAEYGAARQPRSPPVKCGRYSSNRSADNWSTEMTTSSLGAPAGGRPWRRVGHRQLRGERLQGGWLTNFGMASASSAPKSVQLGPQPLVDDLRIGLALHRLHHLPDEEAEQLLLAAL